MLGYVWFWKVTGKEKENLKIDFLIIGFTKYIKENQNIIKINYLCIFKLFNFYIKELK